MPNDSPYWMRGWRCHGYYLDAVAVVQIGRVSRPPGRRATEYRWEVWKNPPSVAGVFASGTEPTLKRAKARVEKVHKERQNELGQSPH